MSNTHYPNVHTIFHLRRSHFHHQSQNHTPAMIHQFYRIIQLIHEKYGERYIVHGHIIAARFVSHELRHVLDKPITAEEIRAWSISEEFDPTLTPAIIASLQKLFKQSSPQAFFTTPELMPAEFKTA